MPTNILSFIFQEERRSGLLLILAATMAMLLANSMFSNTYFEIIEKQITFGAITLDIQHWISEGLMALFFLVVTLEVKREFIDGELRGWKKASFPIVAAVGGMVLPAFIYLILNQSPPGSNGWAIPIATDIAIAVGVLALLGNRIPKNLRIFLLSLAIIDDIGSIIVIALFYSQPTNILALLVAIALSISLIIFQRQKLWLLAYGLIGLLIWYFLVLSGLSGTLAGVIIAVLAPLTSQRHKGSLQMSEKVEDFLLPLTAYLIVPLFVFVSAGLNFSSLSISGDGVTVFWGVVFGLILGKPIGIFLASWSAAKLGFVKKPERLSWEHIAGVGLLAGIGFTISLLIADLSFGSNLNLENASVLGVFIASIISATAGLVMLMIVSKRKTT